MENNLVELNITLEEFNTQQRNILFRSETKTGITETGLIDGMFYKIDNDKIMVPELAKEYIKHVFVSNLKK